MSLMPTSLPNTTYKHMGQSRSSLTAKEIILMSQNFSSGFSYMIVAHCEMNIQIKWRLLGVKVIW